MRIYVAGPMTGVPFFNRPLFDEVSEWLRVRGHEVVNPCDQEWNEETRERFADPMGRPTMPRSYYMRRDLPLLMECEAIVLLPGWEQSVCAPVERHVAEVCGLAMGLWEPKESTVYWTKLNDMLLGTAMGVSRA